MAFPWSLSDSKSPQVSMTLLSILANFNNTVVWMLFPRSLISESSSPYTNLLMTVPSLPLTIVIAITFIFHIFFSSLARSRFLSLFLLSFSFTLWSAGTVKSTPRQILVCRFCWLSLGLVVWLRLVDLFVSQTPKLFRAFHFLGEILGCETYQWYCAIIIVN